MRNISTLVLAFLLLAGPSAVFGTEEAPMLEEIYQVNNEVNTTIRYVAEPQGQDIWRRPTDGTGDCEDFALEKIYRLEKMKLHGWVMVYIDPKAGAHAVAVVTDKEFPISVRNGEVSLYGFILDERTSAIRPFDRNNLPKGPWWLTTPDFQPGSADKVVVIADTWAVRYAVSGNKVLFREWRVQ